MHFRRFLPALILALVAASGAPSPLTDDLDVDAASAADLVPGRTITTTRSWECNGSLRRYGRLPIKVVSRIPNPGRGDAIRLIGCYGDGDPSTVDLILDVRGNGRGVGTGYDAVKIGQSSHDLVIRGRANCGRNASGVHQDAVQIMSGYRIKFKRFRSGNPLKRRWTCWGAGGGFFISHVNGNVPNRVVCVRCRIGVYNQAMRVHDSVRSGARRSIFGYSRSHGIVIGREARNPINVKNRVIRY